MSTDTKPGRVVPCPTCGGDSLFAPSNLWRPFCSERCRAVDLGAWASESFRVEASPPLDDDPDLDPSLHAGGPVSPNSGGRQQPH